MTSPLLLALRTELQTLANPEKAKQMQRYMKSTMPYWGVPLPLCRALYKKHFHPTLFESSAHWQGEIQALWRGAGYREERYAALALAGHRNARAFQTMAVLPLYEEMIVTGAWWDYVDDIAVHRLGEMLQHEPHSMKEAMVAWSQSDNLWKRRSAILCQLLRKEKTDLAFLYQCIEPALDSKEFFLRKAIGWALRQYARTNPKEITRYVHEQAHRLSALSKREALKHLTPLSSST